MCVCVYVGVLCHLVDVISGSCGLELAVPTFCRICHFTTDIICGKNVGSTACASASSSLSFTGLSSSDPELAGVHELGQLACDASDSGALL